MRALKKILVTKISIFIICIIILIVIIIGIITAVAGTSIGYDSANKLVNETRGSNIISSSEIYSEKYKKILNKYLINKGYVSLERLIFYLQRTNNILDVTTLSDKEWEEAYIYNLTNDSKQMIPIKTICNSLKEDDSLPEITIYNGFNSNGKYIEIIDLCIVDDVDITTSLDFSEDLDYMPYEFPLKESFGVTSFVFENRNIELDSSSDLEDNHSGWDFSVPIGTKFYSICDGEIENIVNTQFNDLEYKDSNNSTGNYVIVKCTNNFRVSYFHIQANSVPTKYKIGSSINRGDLLGKTSTTGLSTGPHLHLELKNDEGKLLDALEYIDFS